MAALLQQPLRLSQEASTLVNFILFYKNRVFLMHD